MNDEQAIKELLHKMNQVDDKKEKAAAAINISKILIDHLKTDSTEDRKKNRQQLIVDRINYWLDKYVGVELKETEEKDEANAARDKLPATTGGKSHALESLIKKN